MFPEEYTNYYAILMHHIMNYQKNPHRYVFIVSVLYFSYKFAFRILDSDSDPLFSHAGKFTVQQLQEHTEKKKIN